MKLLQLRQHPGKDAILFGGTEGATAYILAYAEQIRVCIHKTTLTL